ncbi:MAG TPA: PAS domain S-box protein [Patescibacteria group bacterium]
MQKNKVSYGPKNFLEILIRTTALLSQALTLKEMGKIIIKEGLGTLGAKGGEVAVLSADRKYLSCIADIGYSTSYISTIENWRDTPTKQPLLMLNCIKSKRLLYIKDLTKVSSKYKGAHKIVKFMNYHTSILVPIFTKSNLKGCFALFFKEDPKLSNEEINFLVSLAEQFAQAYDRAKLYEEEQSQRKKLEYLIKRLTVLQGVTKVLSKAISLEEVLNTILKQGVSSLGAIGGEISILNEDRKKFKVIAYKGYPKEFTINFKKEWQDLPQSQPLLMWDVVEGKSPVFLTDINAVPTKYTLSKKFAKMTKAKSSAIIPLIVNNEAFGVFYLLFKNQNIFSDEDKQFIITLAQHASQALERAKIHEKEKEVTENLRQSRENWKRLVNTIPQIVWVADKNGDTSYYSNRWNEYSGISLEDSIKGDVLAEVIHPDERQRFVLLKNKAFKKKIPYEMEFRILGVDRQYRWFLFKGLPIKNEKGRIIQWFGTLTDIQEQKAISFEIEKREARFRSLIENSSDAIALLDKKGTILYSSPSTERITGYTPEERQGKSVFHAIYPKDWEKVKSFINELAKSDDEKLLRIIYRRINKDGSIPWMEGIGRNLLENPNIKALVVNYRDITERVEFEQAIQQSRDELEIIFESVADAIIVWNANGTILYCNLAAAKLNRYSSVEELLDEGNFHNYIARFSSIFDENGNKIDEKTFNFSRVLKEKKNVDQTLNVTFREDNLNQWRKIKSSPVLDKQGNIQLVVSVFQDVTEEKQRERIKDEFISTASHELKTPITSAKLYTGILSEKMREFENEKVYTMVSRLDVQLDRLTKLINDLLDVTKIKSGRIIFHKEKVEINEFIKDIIDEMQYTTITHSLRFEGIQNIELQIDKDRMRQVFVNIISNAIKYSPNANKVDIKLSSEKNGITFCAQDYGIGINEDEKEKIFQPFYRSKSAHAGRFSGLGLGLHISSEILKRHGGKIWVDSFIERGTRVYVFLPFVNQKMN